MRTLTLLGAVALAAAPAYAAQPITGNWVTEDGKAVVTIAPCGNQMCGRVSKILTSTGPRTDVHNPDPKLRSRPIEGMEILSGFAADGDSWKGKIYSPEEGKTYRSVLTRTGANALKVQGCVLFFCKTQVWKRAG